MQNPIISELRAVASLHEQAAHICERMISRANQINDLRYDLTQPVGGMMRDVIEKRIAMNRRMSALLVGAYEGIIQKL